MVIHNKEGVEELKLPKDQYSDSFGKDFLHHLKSNASDKDWFLFETRIRVLI